MNSGDKSEILKNLINSIERSGKKPGMISENEVREKIKTVDKNEVIRKLNSMGLGSAANMLRNMSDEDIIREISKNPGILKKLNSLLK